MTIPAGGKHWHGAKKDSWFRHVAVEFPAKAAPTNGWSPSPTKPTLRCNFEICKRKSPPETTKAPRRGFLHCEAITYRIPYADPGEAKAFPWGKVAAKRPDEGR